jgi:hypothetical protein
MKLKRYWFDFENIGKPSALNLGCGVTAHSVEDAKNILSSTVFIDVQFPRILKVISDVDISLLDPKHVIPNMYEPTDRGVWFPIGYRSESA